MTMTWTPTWTHDRLPTGVAAFLGPPCRTCATTTLSIDVLDGHLAPLIRSTEPDPATGRYILQPHLHWCPVWTGETPALPCPECGAPVDEMESSPGISVTVPHPLFGTAHLIGTAEEVYANPDASFYGAGSPKLEPAFTVATVSPCGHTLRGDAARDVILRFAQLRVEHMQAEADAVIAVAQPLLAAAEAAGRAPLAAAYREAVRARSGTAAGLLAALRILHDGTTR